MFRPNRKTPAAEPDPVTPAEAAASGFLIFVPYKSLMLAVSGGSDSMALLYLTQGCLAGCRSSENKQKIVVGHIDHKLREASAADSAFVEDFCARNDIPFVRLAWEGEKPVTGIQASARAVRYKLLAQAARAQACEAIVTAHTLDDQAETVLMRLIRGSGLSGLSGMAPVSETGGMPLLRPMLSFSRVRLRATLKNAGIAWRDDASNEDARFLRARLRKMMPQLAAEGLDALQLARLAKKFARANAALDKQAQNLVAPVRSGEIEISAYRAASEEIRLRALKLMIASIHAQTYPPADEALEELDAMMMDGVARRTLGGVIFSSGNRYLHWKDEKDPRKDREGA